MTTSNEDRLIKIAEAEKLLSELIEEKRKVSLKVSASRESIRYHKRFIGISKPASGRKEGYIPTKESRLKATLSHPNSCRVHTPDGEFHSVLEASRHFDLPNNSVKYRCSLGERQRAGEIIINRHTNKPLDDWSEWYRIDKTSRVQKKPVRTPYGEFDSAKAAAEAENISPSAISHKLKTKEGYDYV